MSHFGGETRGGYGPAHVVRNPSCAGPTTRSRGLKAFGSANQGKRRARCQLQDGIPCGRSGNFGSSLACKKSAGCRNIWGTDIKSREQPADFPSLGGRGVLSTGLILFGFFRRAGGNLRFGPRINCPQPDLDCCCRRTFHCAYYFPPEASRPAMTQRSRPVRAGAAGCQVPADRRQRMGTG